MSFYQTPLYLIFSGHTKALGLRAEMSVKEEDVLHSHTAFEIFTLCITIYRFKPFFHSTGVLLPAVHSTCTHFLSPSCDCAAVTESNLLYQKLNNPTCRTKGKPENMSFFLIFLIGDNFRQIKESLLDTPIHPPASYPDLTGTNLLST